MSDLTNTKYRRFSFDQEGAEKIKSSVDKGQNWPVVYILNGDKEAYVGVFIGKDLYFKDGHVQTNRNAISKDDKTSGIRLTSTSNEEADKLIRRTYKVLLTRGIKGCYIYCEDEALRNYLKEKLNKN